MRSSPFSWINEQAKVRVFVVLFSFTVALSVAGSWINRSLNGKTTARCDGIVGFELAGSRERADKIVACWSDDARKDAFLGLGFDYLFLFVYPLTISLACHLAARRDERFARRTWIVGAILSWLVLAAAPLDATENYALIRVLKSSSGDFWPALARWCAIPKFGLIIIGTLYVMLWLVLELVRRTARPDASTTLRQER